MALAASTATQKAPTRTTTRKTQAPAPVVVEDVIAEEEVDPELDDVEADAPVGTSASARNNELHIKNNELFTLRDRLIKDHTTLKKKLDGREDLTFQERYDDHRLSQSIDRVTAEIVDANYGLVKKYVKKFTSNTSKDDSDDFLGAGLVGLMRAIDSYRVNKGKFGSWAFKPIQREVLRAVRDHEYQNMSHSDFESRPDILRAFEALRTESGNEDYVPSSEAVAARLGVKVDQVKRVLEAPRLESLNNPVGEEGDATTQDKVVDPSLDVADAVLSRMEVDALERYGLTSLDAREMFVLSRRFGLDCEPEQRLSAIGEILNLSREAVRQVESKALAKMQHPVTLRKIARQGRV